MLFSLALLADGVCGWENVNSLLLEASGRNAAALPGAEVTGGAGGSLIDGGVAVAGGAGDLAAADLVLRREVRRSAGDAPAARARLPRVLDDIAAAAARAALLRVLGRDPADNTFASENTRRKDRW